jgi:hypothetical protein
MNVRYDNDTVISLLMLMLVLMLIDAGVNRQELRTYIHNIVPLYRCLVAVYTSMLALSCLTMEEACLQDKEQTCMDGRFKDARNK